MKSAVEVAANQFPLIAKAAQFTVERPFVAVGAAVAAGYVLGGGLLTKTTLRLGSGLGAWLLPFLQRQLVEILESTPTSTMKS